MTCKKDIFLCHEAKHPQDQELERGAMMREGAAGLADVPGAVLCYSRFAEGGPAGTGMLRAEPLPHTSYGNLI